MFGMRGLSSNSWMQTEVVLWIPMEFFQGCLRFRGPARSMDVGKLIQDQKWMIHNQGKFQEYVQDELAQVKEKLSLLCDSFSAEGDEDPFSKES
mmetsp:Transcript_11018/g.26031  ORF Transcript_11018/g.26031 Transcript_11018/m.26031 type:complete len:94 (-) Transcript_11018:20-301(-)